MSRDTSFSYSFLVLPADQRRAVGVVWDFCRAVDDAVDEEPVVTKAAAQVVAWRDEVSRVFGSGPPATEEGRHLQPVVQRFRLSREPFEALVDGVEMDLHRQRYETFEELVEYCKRVASAVGLMCVEIFGCRGVEGRDYAFNLGLALQITNIIRDVKDDLSRDRIYLPMEDLRRFGCSEADLAVSVPSQAVRRLLRFECLRAREYYAPRRRGASGRLRPRDGGGGDHGRHLLRDPPAHREARLRRVLGTRPRAQAGACAHRRRGLDPQPHGPHGHAPGTGAPRVTPDVIVIGAGFAGLSAATALVEDGARVQVLEARPILGGRASAVRDSITGETLDNGQHVLMGCYDQTLAFLERIGAADRVWRQSGLGLTIAERNGRQIHAAASSAASAAPSTRRRAGMGGPVVGRKAVGAACRRRGAGPRTGEPRSGPSRTRGA